MILKLTGKLRIAKRYAFNTQKIMKSNETFKVVGCSPTFFKNWKKYELHEDMTVEDYDYVWVVDLCSLMAKCNWADGTDRYIFNPRINLRPTFINENSSKGSQINFFIF